MRQRRFDVDRDNSVERLSDDVSTCDDGAHDNCGRAGVHDRVDAGHECADTGVYDDHDDHDPASDRCESLRAAR